MNNALPCSSVVDVRALSRLFLKTTNSYKLLFFQSLLSLLPRIPAIDNLQTVTLEELAIEMVAISWYPHNFFKLSFGVQDKTHEILDKLEFSLESSSVGNADAARELRKAIQQQKDRIGLYRVLRYVPYRLLEPFFVIQLRSRKDYLKNDLICELAEKNFNTIKPLYRFIDQGRQSAIQIHPDWFRYLLENYSIVRGWAMWEWLNYLQERNPNIPAISNKLFPPPERASLTKQAQYWKDIMKETEVRCMYSGEILNNQSFALDHFIPWSFVCHDQLWNLLPVTQSANSAKSNSLPANDYIEPFINLQIEGLIISNKHMTEKVWCKMIESFIADLRVTSKDLLDNEKVRKAYLATLPPMISLAEQIGFMPDWKYTRI